MSRSLQEIYDQFADTYEANRSVFDLSEVFEAFYQHLGVCGSLLDLGCGAGEPWAKYFLECGWRVTGVDFSRRMVELAARYTPEMRPLTGDMRKVEFEPESFDVVTAIYSLFHVPTKDHRQLFGKIHDWLVDGGWFFFTYASCEYTGQPEFDGVKEFMGRQLYYSHTTPERLKKQLGESGFRLAQSDYRTIGGETFLWVTARKD